jgi:hypothetical protein
VTGMTHDNDGRYPDESEVLVRYPLDGPGTASDRESWPWLPGTIEQQCGPDEWLVTIEDRRLAELDDGSPAPEGTPDEDLLFPQCFRDASELRQPGRRLYAHADLDGQGTHWLKPGQSCGLAAGPGQDREAGE